MDLTTIKDLEIGGLEGGEDTVSPPFLPPIIGTDIAFGKGEVIRDKLALPTSGETTRLVRVRVQQCDSISASLGAFVARFYSKIPKVTAVYQLKTPDLIRFYIVLSDDDELLDSVFNAERFFYTRFAGEVVDFVVLPGLDLQGQIPSDARLISRDQQ